MSSSNAILIIDDEPFLRYTLATILNRVGYQTAEAATAQEGLQLLDENAYDLIFLDLQMPDRSGLEILPGIRQKYPDTPVLILTANASLEKAIEALKMGARDYLMKPIDPGEIITRVDDLFKDEQLVDKEGEEAELGWVALAQPLSKKAFALKNPPPKRSSPKGIEQEPPGLPNRNRYLCQGPFLLDLQTHEVTIDGITSHLPICTFQYLMTLLRHSPSTISYQDLVMEAQGYQLTKTEAQDLARWRIHRLRKVLEQNPQEPRYLITVPGVGYRLVL